MKLNVSLLRKNLDTSKNRVMGLDIGVWIEKFEADEREIAHQKLKIVVRA
jgi:hypothetical protein